MSIIANPESAKAIKPSDGAFDTPAMPSEALFGIDASSRDAREHASSAYEVSTSGIVVALVAMNLAETLARTSYASAKTRKLVEKRFEHARVVDICAGEQHEKWHSVGVREDVPLRSRLGAVHRVGTCQRPPFLAATLAESTNARSQSMAPA